MKKLLFVIIAAIAFVACEKEPFVQANDFTEREISNKVSLNQALVYAENSINGIGTSTRSTSRKVKNSEIFVAKPSTRSAESEEVSFYLINYENNEGYAMVSTDSRTTPVYAYSDEGNLTPEDFENNPGLKIFLEGAILNYEDEIANCSTYALGDDDRWPIDVPDTLDDPRPIYVDGIYCYTKTDTTTVKVDELLTTAWHQNRPYNQIISERWDGDYPSGCGPTAIAQIMAYHRHPSYRIDPEDNFVMYNWDLIRSNIRSNLGSDEDDATTAISTLMYHIATAADAFPGENNSVYTYPENIIEALDEFDYTCSSVVDFSFSTIKSQIDSSKPVYVIGTHQTTGEGHAWVIDGYEFIERRKKYYHSQRPFALYKTENLGTIRYYHCNWGKVMSENAHSSNGLYLATDFIYTIDNKMIYDITPNN